MELAADSSDSRTAMESAADALDRADFILFATDAGMSADSSLPVFASLSSHPTLQTLQLSYDQIASPDMLVKRPELFYGFWLAGRKRYQEARPHTGYEILARWANNARVRSGSHVDAIFTVTSNVDGFHLRAGMPEVTLAQVHGSAVGQWQCGGE
jgi:NAD-dependent SIR2 family protein deacetylase